MRVCTNRSAHYADPSRHFQYQEQPRFYGRKRRQQDLACELCSPSIGLGVPSLSMCHHPESRRAMSPTVPDSKLLYYGEVREYGIVFVRHADVCRLARIYWAVTSCSTWGEFASKVPAGVMREVLNDSKRVSFDSFCRGWLYQSVAWPEQAAMEWFRDCIQAYRALEPHTRYPLPEEECWAIDACDDGLWPE